MATYRYLSINSQSAWPFDELSGNLAAHIHDRADLRELLLSAGIVLQSHFSQAEMYWGDFSGLYPSETL
jgi:hypothetical protein